jgi:phosphotriesterase-related protein
VTATLGGFVRTVAGDVAPGDLGVTYAHEHLVIDPGRVVDLEPEFELSDVAAMAEEVQGAAELGLGAAVDAMPCDTGRNPLKLAELSRRTGVHIIAPTGLHHERWYPPDHWGARLPVDELADRFVADIEVGIDAGDYAGQAVDRTTVRAGVIKIAGSQDGVSARDRRIFEAAALAHRRTGAPILTHCENGSGALEQIGLLDELGVALAQVSLSHVDKIVDRGYHRAMLESGANVVYDQSFRWGDRPNGTLELLAWAAESGLDGRVMLGMDAARRGYYRVHGGWPGLRWLLSDFTDAMAARGIDGSVRERLFVANPARAFAFAATATTATGG